MPESLWSSALGSGVSGLFGIAGNALQYHYSKKLAAQQNQYNLDMWKMQAEYNSPQAQMQRFQEAGLNPNLIYGQGNNGNMSQAPEMVTPNAPDYSRSMQKLGEAFNIESLRTMVANRKKAQHEERLAQLAMFDREDERDALARLTSVYSYDPKTGRWNFTPGGVDVDANNPRGNGVGNTYLGGALLERYIAEHDPRMHLQALQRNYLEPQIQMANYDWKFYPYSYWIGQGTKTLNSIANFIPKPKLTFSRQMGSVPRYQNFGRSYNY